MKKVVDMIDSAVNVHLEKVDQGLEWMEELEFVHNHILQRFLNQSSSQEQLGYCITSAETILAGGKVDFDNLWQPNSDIHNVTEHEIMALVNEPDYLDRTKRDYEEGRKKLQAILSVKSDIEIDIEDEERYIDGLQQLARNYLSDVHEVVDHIEKGG